MSVFNPSGVLNISSDPSDLDDGDMVRCKNMRINQKGKVTTRYGSNKINTQAIDTDIQYLVEQGGDRYVFAGTSLYLNESSIASSLTNTSWSAIKYNAFNDTTQQVYAINGTDRKRIEGAGVYEFGIEAPTSAPTVAVGSLTGLTGDYSAKYTYAKKVGSVVVSESNPSPASSTTTLANQSLDITWTASSDSQVTHVRVYRTTAGGSIYYHDQDILIGTTTVDTNTVDGSLVTSVETDHDRPPLGKYILGPNFNGVCFILKDKDLYFCKAKQPEYWPATNFIEVGTEQLPLVAAIFHNGQLYCATKRDIFFIQGTGTESFFPIKMTALTGAQNQFGFVSVLGRGIYHTGHDGIYLYSNTADRKITEDTLDPIFSGESVNGMDGVSEMSSSWLFHYGVNLYFGYTSSGEDKPSNVLVFNLETNRYAYYKYDFQIAHIVEDNFNNRVLVGDRTGFLREIENKSKIDDSGAAISWECQSKDFTLQTRKHFPRWIKYDVDVLSGTALGSLLLDGKIHQSHMIIGSRNTKRRLLDVQNGDRESIRISGEGKSVVYLAETE